MDKSKLAAAILTAIFFVGQPSHAGVVYSNGPLDGQNQAFTISDGFLVADSFSLASAVTVDGARFGAWFFPGDFGLTVDWKILDGSPGAGGNVISAGTAIQNNSFQFTNASGYDIYLERINLTPTPLLAGTYWLELLNATTSLDAVDPNFAEFWDANGGPSQAYSADLIDPPNSLGDITTCSPNVHPSGRCSETFDITSTSVPEPSSLALLAVGLLGFVMMRRRLPA